MAKARAPVRPSGSWALLWVPRAPSFAAKHRSHGDLGVGWAHSPAAPTRHAGGTIGGEKSRPIAPVTDGETEAQCGDLRTEVWLPLWLLVEVL